MTIYQSLRSENLPLLHENKDIIYKLNLLSKKLIIEHF